MITYLTGALFQSTVRGIEPSKKELTMKGGGGIFLVKDDWPTDKPIPAVRSHDIRFESMTFGSFDEFVAVSDRIEGLMKDLGFGDIDGTSVVAFSEALNNALRETREKQSWKQAVVNIMIHPDHWFFVFIITRTDPAQACNMHFNELPEWDAEQGRGAYIMRTLADVVALNFPSNTCMVEFIIGLYRDNPHNGKPVD